MVINYFLTNAYRDFFRLRRYLKLKRILIRQVIKTRLNRK